MKKCCPIFQFSGNIEISEDHVKKALLFFLFIFALPSYAQVVGTAAPDAELESEEYDLTDQQRWESQTYVHQGLINREMEEKCNELSDSGACKGRGKTKFMGVDSEIIKMVSKVYSLFGGVMGMQGGGFKGKPKDTGGNTQEVETPEAEPGKAEGDQATGDNADASKKEGEDKKDYCGLIPAAGEVVGMTMQTLGQQEIETTETQESPQKAQLYKAARSHRTRAQSAKIQGYTWGATTACYAYYMTMGGIVIDWKVIAKAAGAGFLTTFWLSESKKQDEYADEVQAIAESLPGRGDCNPHTEKNCYCSQPETQYDTANCMEILNKKVTDTTSYSVPCVDKDLKADAKCTCVGRENCFDTEFFSDIKGTGLADFGNTSAGKQFKNLTNGVLTNGKLSSAAASTSANAKRILKDLEDKVDDIPSLSKSQMEEAKSLSSYGVPRSVASLLAGQKENSFGKNKVASLTSGAGPAANLNKAARSNSAGAVLRFNTTKSNIGSKSKSSNNSFNSLLNKFKKKGNSKGNAKVLKFAQKAEREAQITKNKDRPIFEIISRRYQVSGWRRLEIE